LRVRTKFAILLVRMLEWSVLGQFSNVPFS
jgi:hypothetical protein